jgi:hypothetical protein
MAFTPCTSTLGANIAGSCSAPRIKGYEQTGFIVKKSDIDLTTTTISGTNSRIITSLGIKAGGVVSAVYNHKQNPLPFGGTKTTYNRDADAYDKLVQFYFEGIGGASAKNVVEPLKSTEYVIALERKDHRGDGSFQVFGFQVGMNAANNGGAQVQDEETGYWLITMATQEPYAEMSLFDTDYATTKADFDAIVATSI